MKGFLRSVINRLRSNPTSAAPTSRAGEFARTMVVVVPLTLLIWVYAEQAQKGPDQSVAVLISVAASDPNLTDAVIDSADIPVALNLYGPRGQIEQLKNRIDAALTDRRLRIVLSAADATVGPHSVDTARLLNNDPIFANSGVTVLGAAPSQIRVTVDPLVTRDAVVVLPRELPVTLLSHNFDPQRVTIRGPAPAMEAAFPTGSPTVTVDVSALASIGGAGGVKTLDLPLIPPRDSRLKLSVPRVNMKFEAGSTVITGTIPSVFIDVVRPVSDDGRSKVTVTGGPVIHNVQVRGPASLVNKYTGGQPERGLRAMLFITQEDVGKSDLRREVMWPSLDDGAVRIIGGPYEVGFDVRELSASAGDRQNF